MTIAMNAISDHFENPKPSRLVRFGQFLQHLAGVVTGYVIAAFILAWILRYIGWMN